MNGRLKNWLGGEALFSLLEIALVAALAATAAYWTWQLAAPAAVGASARASASHAISSDRPLKRDLFGASGGAPPAVSSSGIKLVGVASPRAPDTGHAVFRLDNGKSATARAQETIVPGTVLREVHPDYVLVERGGILERLTLERRNAGR